MNTSTLVAIRAAAAMSLSVLCTAAIAADGPTCLSARDSRTAVEQGRASPLAVVKRNAERSTGGEMLRARLCSAEEGRLVYLLTMLRRDGQVVTLQVEARGGGTRHVETRPPRLERRDTPTAN
jgi:uncharacterized membrane protein YkoI